MTSMTPSRLSSFREGMLHVCGRVTLALAAMLLACTVLIMLYGVVMRYVLGGAPIWVDELTRYLIIASVMLAIGVVWAEGAHMRVALLERRLPPRMARALIHYQWWLTLVLMAGATWMTWHYAMSASMFRTMGLGISRSVPMLSMPIGFALITAQVLLHGPRPLRSQTLEIAPDEGDADISAHDDKTGGPRT